MDDSFQMSPIDKVCDDLLISILVRLPVECVFKCSLVSKKWKLVIASNVFLDNYYRIRKILQPHLVAIIQTTPNLCQKTPTNPPGPEPPLMNILPVSRVFNNQIVRHRPTGNQIFKPVQNKLGYFISSSNGLILCGHHPERYYIFNPLTRKCKSILPPPPERYYNFSPLTRKCKSVLPPPPIIHEAPSMALVCLENTSKFVLEYKIISASASFTDNIVPVHIYSSRTCKWVESDMIGTEEFTLCWTKPPLALNGVLHWCPSLSTLAICDLSYYSNRPSVNRVQLIELPPHDQHGPSCNSSSFTRSTGDDALWFGSCNKEGMQFWMLPKGEHGSYMRSTIIYGKEWILMHTLDCSTLSKVVAQEAQEVLRCCRVYYQSKHGVGKTSKEYIETDYFKLEALISSAGIVVLLRPSTVDMLFLYDLKSNSVEIHPYSYTPPAGYPTPADDQIGRYPCVEPLSLSSYAL